MELWYTEEWTENTRFSIKVKEMIHTEQTPFQRLDIMDTDEFGKLFTLDGLIMVTEKDEFIYHDMIVHTPMAVNPDIQHVLVIGGGDGGTVRELCRYSSIKTVDMVDIDEKVVRACQKYLPFTSCSLEDKRVTLAFADGLKFVEEAPEGKYDLIIVDSTDPIGPGEGLFTLQFYQNCYRALSGNGILVNQNESPYFEDTAKEMKRAFQKIQNIFPIAKVYQAFLPTYPSGHWMFGFGSKKLDPIQDANLKQWNQLGLKTRYYNTELHLASFVLPNYVKEMLDHE